MAVSPSRQQERDGWGCWLDVKITETLDSVLKAQRSFAEVSPGCAQTPLC